MKKILAVKGRLFVKIVGILAVVVLALSIIQTVVITNSAGRKIKDSNTKVYSNIASIYSDLITKTLDECFAELDFYTKADIVQTEDSQQIIEWLKDQKDKRYEVFDYVAWVGPDANFDSDKGSHTTVADRDYFKGIMQDGKDYFIDNPVTSKTTGKTIIHVCKAAKSNGKNIGFFCGVIEISHIADLLKGINLGDNGAVAILSGKGEKFAADANVTLLGDKNETAASEISEKLSEAAAAAMKSGTSDSFWFKASGLDNELFIVNPIDKSPWSMALVLKDSYVNGIATEIRSTMIIFGIGMAVIIILIASVLIYRSLKPLGTVESSILDIATGNADLTKRINIHSNDEIGRVVDGFNKFSEKMQTIISTMKESKNELSESGETLKASAEDTSSAITQILKVIDDLKNNVDTQSNSVSETAGAVNEIASNIESLNRLIEGQSSAVTEASAAVEEMIGNINSVNSSVQKMAEEFSELDSKASVGVQKQEDVNNRIQTIESESQALKEANLVISNIAAQTNLLAMNAAIEAAHAGEAGKGFSVVADEIRKLSETSSSQSKTIGEQLNRITDSIDSIVTASAQARDAFGDVSVGIKETNNLVQEIKNSMLEQGEGSKQISIALNNMNDSTQEVRSSSYEMSEGNKAILEEVKNLQESSTNLKSGMDEMAGGATRINETGKALSELTGSMETAITNIAEQVDQFKV